MKTQKRRGRQAHAPLFPFRWQRARRLLKKSNRTQVELASHLNHSDNWVYRILSGRQQTMVYDDIIGFCRFVGCKPEAILDDSRMSPEDRRLWRREANK